MNTTPANENASLLVANQTRARRMEEERQAAVAASHWTGSKHQRGRDLAQVAKDVRADLKASGIKASVRLSRYSMGQSLTVEIVEVPVGLVVLSIRRIREDMGLAQEGRNVKPWMSPDGSAMIERAEQIANAYNYDKSDSQTDLFQTEFFLTVRFSSEIVDAQREEIRAALVACA